MNHSSVITAVRAMQAPVQQGKASEAVLDQPVDAKPVDMPAEPAAPQVPVSPAANDQVSASFTDFLITITFERLVRSHLRLNGVLYYPA